MTSYVDGPLSWQMPFTWWRQLFSFLVIVDIKVQFQKYVHTGENFREFQAFYCLKMNWNISKKIIDSIGMIIKNLDHFGTFWLTNFHLKFCFCCHHFLPWPSPLLACRIHGQNVNRLWNITSQSYILVLWNLRYLPKCFMSYSNYSVCVCFEYTPHNSCQKHWQLNKGLLFTW